MARIYRKAKTFSADLLSIVIISHNAKTLLKRCLDSVYMHVRKPFEVILVDNASSDGTTQMVEQEFQNVKIIKNRRNRGVAPARNQGIRVAGGRYILILDDDTIIVGDAIEKMIEFMKRNSDIGVCGPKLLNSQRQLLYSCKRFPHPFAFVLNRLVRIPSNASPHMLWRHLMLDWDHKKPAVVDYLIGACQLINRKALLTVGMYDERIFYGPEDIDFCFRMWENGWGVWHFPYSTVIHETQRLTKRKPLTMLAVRHFLAVLRMFLRYRYGNLLRITLRNDRERCGEATT